MHFSKTEKYTLHVLGVVSRPASKNTWIPQGHRSAFPPATPRRSLGAPDNAPLFFAFLRDARNTRLSVLSLPLHLTNPIYELHYYQVHLGCSWITLAACKSACMMYAQQRLGRRANTDHPPAKKNLHGHCGRIARPARASANDALAWAASFVGGHGHGN